MLLNGSFGQEVLAGRREQLAYRHRRAPIHLVRFFQDQQRGVGIMLDDDGDYFDIPLSPAPLTTDKEISTRLFVSADYTGGRASITHRFGEMLHPYHSEHYLATVLQHGRNESLVMQMSPSAKAEPLPDAQHEFLVEATVEAIEVNADLMAAHGIANANDLHHWYEDTMNARYSESSAQ